MSNTKWDELRLAMAALTPAPAFRCQSTNGHYSQPDHEWFYHFRDGGYSDMQFVDIIPQSAEQRTVIAAVLRKIHVPGDATPLGFRVYGYAQPGQFVDYF